MLTEREAEQFRIRQLVEMWALTRDAGDWDGFASVWHSGGWMTATWFQGPADDFIRASREGFDACVSILHFLGGSRCEVTGGRAVAQTKMTIQQRAGVHGITIDVTCTGRFYDFLEKRAGAWGIVRRQPVYEKDRLDPVDPGARLTLDPEPLARFPAGYRHLAYLQSQLGYRIAPRLPGLRGPEVERLYREGRDWLGGSAAPGVPAADGLLSPAGPG
jgi:SnoaL-like domain